MWKRFSRWLSSFRAWETLRDTGVWRYQQNRVTGRRVAFRVGGGWQPCDTNWLATGVWKRMPAPPRRTSATATGAA